MTAFCPAYQWFGGRLGASEARGGVCFLGGQASGFRRNQAPKTVRLNQVPSWEFQNRRKSFTPRQLARILWDFTYLCWANTSSCYRKGRELLSFRSSRDRAQRQFRCLTLY